MAPTTAVPSASRRPPSLQRQRARVHAKYGYPPSLCGKPDIPDAGLSDHINSPADGLSVIAVGRYGSRLGGASLQSGAKAKPTPATRILRSLRATARAKPADADRPTILKTSA